MPSPCFLLDEHIPHSLARGLLLREPAIQIFVIGGKSGEPGIETPDQDLLRWIEEHGCLLVTNNRSSMPRHLSDHLAAGRHLPGILVVPRRLALGEIVDELHLIWAASQPDEYRDLIVYLPVSR
jgi:hypothetical protein